MTEWVNVSLRSPLDVTSPYIIIADRSRHSSDSDTAGEHRLAHTVVLWVHVCAESVARWTLLRMRHTTQNVITLAASRGKRNVTVWRPSVRPSVPSANLPWLTRGQHATWPAWRSHVFNCRLFVRLRPKITRKLCADFHEIWEIHRLRNKEEFIKCWNWSEISSGYLWYRNAIAGNCACLRLYWNNGQYILSPTLLTRMQLLLSGYGTVPMCRLYCVDTHHRVPSRINVRPETDG